MKIMNKGRILLVFLLIAGFAKATRAQQFEKSIFYKVMDTGDLAAIDAQIDIVKASSQKYKDGYEGALLMRKADKLAVPLQKLKYFKQGRIKFETALMADPDNTEYHFLRLAIQEHAPKIVKYHSDIEKDKAIVKKNFKDQPQSVQHAILDYCKNSKVLHAEDFQ
ncbi:hypothetical protein [Mucilaginibacter sp. L3T2-6]|uniref:hypothetical protein n=1 Tax=Mucilaginibacter sp. L3T2-6 TaxID=3062491 RepID=UPI0026762C3F|nr:hypothetical protein [Mucilaginibacter sp. L3T2-6]MDO3640829.1 hypothetical protein [Mucilaginibacter sp. L3T2-6]MDV6213695.1 hypothetical protein [Mucilaginibacter sp. L3T2-6]